MGSAISCTKVAQYTYCLYALGADGSAVCIWPFDEACISDLVRYHVNIIMTCDGGLVRLLASGWNGLIRSQSQCLLVIVV